MKTTIDLSNPKNVELLMAELVRVFPDCARYLHAQDHITRYEGGVWLAYQQTAWQDVSWGWQSANDCPESTRCTMPDYRPCSLGGRFVRERYSVGD